MYGICHQSEENFDRYTGERVLNKKIEFKLKDDNSGNDLKEYKKVLKKTCEGRNYLARDCYENVLKNKVSIKYTKDIDSDKGEFSINDYVIDNKGVEEAQYLLIFLEKQTRKIDNEVGKQFNKFLQIILTNFYLCSPELEKIKAAEI